MKRSRSSVFREESEDEDEFFSDSDKSEQEIVKRPRGRPRKSAMSGSPEPAVRTPRGRPRKVVLTGSPAESETSSVSNSSPAPPTAEELGNRHTIEFPCDDELYDAIRQIMKGYNLSDLSVKSIETKLERRFKVCPFLTISQYKMKFKHVFIQDTVLHLLALWNTLE
jgi:hypothetical protein